MSRHLKPQNGRSVVFVVINRMIIQNNLKMADFSTIYYSIGYSITPFTILELT